MRASILAAGLVVLFVSTSSETLRAGEYAGPTSAVDIPALRPEEMAKSVVIAKGVGSDAAALTINLLNPDVPPKSGLEKYELAADPAAKTWKIEAVAKTKQRKLVAKLTLDGDSLSFKWEPNATKTDSGPLRNCVITIAGPADQAVALRAPIVQKAIPLDLAKDSVRIPLADDLPDETSLTLAVAGLQGEGLTGTVSVPEAKVKESVLIGMKAADATSPGIQLRVVLWKASPTAKPEIVVRAELLAMAQPVVPVIGQAAPPPTTPTTTPASSAPPAVVDPTRLSPDIPLFTSRSLSAAKSAITRQMQQAKTQLNQCMNLGMATQQRLAQFDDDPDESEALAISQLQSDLSTLNQQKTTLENTIIPNLETQLAAIDPLEKLRQSLHLKATLGLRVYYTVGGKPVNVFVASDESTTK